MRRSSFRFAIRSISGFAAAPASAFIDIQREDAFARWYMEAIGHYEFGAGLRPIRFPA